jgi:uroporphyrinogen III methyltransferase/synthase
MTGKVYLVGAGPGDPGLITAKGIQCLARADVVIYDRLINTDLLRHVPADAEQIYAGKAARDHALSQDEINSLLVEKAQGGKTVVRLKGGDPFVFGRGGEELEALFAAGVPFEVVPGISAALAAAAYAGIPVTHRGLASSFAVITGHEDPTKPESAVDWSRLAQGADTLVLLMGVENLAHITAQLIAHGRPAETPVALVRWGTWPQQETVSGTLGDIVDRLSGRSFKPPAVILVGQTVALRERLRWFDNRPLSGKRVLVTRARDQASRLSELLREQGAETLEAPAIEIAEPEDYASLDAALERLGSYTWVVFTSANGVGAMFGRLETLGRDSRAFGDARVAAIGPATADALRQHGVNPDLMPDQYLTAAVAQALAATGLGGTSILLPRTDIAGEALAEALEAEGATVDQVVAYRTLQASRLDPEVERLLRDGGIDIVTFASASTVKNLVGLLAGDIEPLRQTTVACIGPVTARTAREAGLRVDLEAKEHTLQGLIDALVEGVKGDA